MIHIWTDGSCADEKGGWAALIDNEGSVTHISGSAEQTTNVRMEYIAVIKALQWVYPELSYLDKVVVHTDSQILVDQVEGKARVNRNADLWLKVKSWVESEITPHVTLKWHRRTSNIKLKWRDEQAKIERKSLDPTGLRKLNLKYNP